MENYDFWKVKICLFWPINWQVVAGGLVFVGSVCVCEVPAIVYHHLLYLVVGDGMEVVTMNVFVNWTLVSHYRVITG